MTSCVRYLDINGIPVANTALSTKKRRQAISDANGIVRFDPPLDADDVLYPIGFATATIIPCADITPPPVTNPPIEDRPNPQQGGYWKVGMASPNDSTRRFLGSKFGSYADCVRSWQGAGYGGDGGCTFVPPPEAPPTESPLGKWVKDTVSGLSDFVAKLSGSISSLSGRVDALQKGLDGIWDKLEGWLVDRILGIIWKALTAEKKEEA